MTNPNAIPTERAARHFQRSLIRTMAALLLFSVLAGAQPAHDPHARPSELVEITRIDSTIKLDIRYATSQNFMKRPMYTEPRAFLQKPAAEALMHVQRALRARGFGLIVFDGYRPWSVTKEFWDETPADKHGFVADPKQGSKHNRGCAVDLSLINLKNGKEIVMTSPYDDFTEKASPGYRGGSRTQRRLRDMLRSAMEKEGFAVDKGEWWHFDYKDWRSYDVLDIPFNQVQTQQ